jgi:hypothetical protein
LIMGTSVVPDARMGEPGSIGISSVISIYYDAIGSRLKAGTTSEVLDGLVIQSPIRKGPIGER